MRYAIDICPLGDLADPRAIVRLGRAAEDHGWDGISIWDSLGPGMGTVAADPFVALTAVASTTARLRLITSVIALARRRPQLVVQSAASLDLVSEGRLVLGVGAGEDEADFTAFAEDFDRPSRIGRMDEALAIVDAGLRGERLEHEGPHFVARDAVLGPRPSQQPRPPMWLGAMKPGGIRRAAHWDGWIVVGMSADGSSMEMTAADFTTRMAILTDARRELGSEGEPFQIAILGVTGSLDAGASASGVVGASDGVAGYAEAGATWWLESLSPMRGSIEELEAVVRAGPPGG